MNLLHSHLEPQTAGQLIIFVLAMVLHPEVQARAQAEIDAVVGRDRAPTFADRDNLPYIRACVRETLRWRTVGPLGTPRATSQDDWYEGYFIPKGALVLGNIWCVCWVSLRHACLNGG